MGAVRNGLFGNASDETNDWGQLSHGEGACRRWKGAEVAWSKRRRELKVVTEVGKNTAKEGCVGK